MHRNLELSYRADACTTKCFQPLPMTTPSDIAHVPKAPQFPHVAAVLVLFAPHADPAHTMRTALGVVGRVVLVDNAPEGHPMAAAWRDEPGVVVLSNANRGGLAGAYNVAIRWLESHAPAMQYVAFIDDDSNASVLAAFLSDTSVVATLARKDTAAVAPAHRERATGSRAKHLVLSRWRWRYLEREARGLRQVAFVINSMAVWRMEALQQIGAYNEWLGIDHVDTEYCLRASRLGLAVYLHGDFEFAQSIGQRYPYRLLGRVFQSGGHSSNRRYLIARSLCRLFRVWFAREPAFAALCMARLGYELLGIVVAERERPSKLSALGRGALAGLLSRP